MFENCECFFVVVGDVFVDVYGVVEDDVYGVVGIVFVKEEGVFGVVVFLWECCEYEKFFVWEFVFVEELYFFVDVDFVEGFGSWFVMLYGGVCFGVFVWEEVVEKIVGFM